MQLPPIRQKIRREMKQANTYEEIEPLVKLCKAGRLFDVQDWISAGKPTNLPPAHTLKRSKQSPLQIALNLGFHSLVQVLLEEGASLDDPRYPHLSQALHKRRLDLVQLLVKHGADIHSVPMEDVFDTWNNEIVDFFIERGADLKTGNPLAYALCSRIRPALGLFMRYRDHYSSFRDQIDIALRHHCKEGNLKWVSLLLWAGADPYSKGPDSPHDDDPESFSSALELAAFYGHFEVFKLKKIRLEPKQSIAEDLLRNACFSKKPEILKMLLDNGFSPRKLRDCGSSLIRLLIYSMSWDFDPFSYTRHEKDIDSYKSRDVVKMMHMLVRNGARWAPEDSSEINSARRSFLKMKADYVMEFIWLMSEYKACTRNDIETLIKTVSMRSLLSNHFNRYDEMLNALPPFSPTSRD